MARNYVEIQVRALDEAKPDLTRLKADLDDLGRKTGTARVDVDDEAAKLKLLDINARLAALSRQLASPRVTVAGAARAEAQIARLNHDLDHLGDHAAGPAGEAGGNAGQSFTSRFASYLRPGKMQVILAGVMSGLAAVPALAGALGVAAGIALGAKLLIGSKKSQGPLYQSWTSFSHGLVHTMQQAAQPMVAPLRDAFRSLAGFAGSIGPELRQVFSALGGFVMPLTRGLEGLVRGVLPGFTALMRAAAPAVSALARLMAGLGRSLGGMFTAFAPAIRASADVLRMLGSVLNGLLPAIGGLAASLARSLGPVLQGFGQALHAVMPAVVTVGKVLGSLAGAVLKSLSGALGAVAVLVRDMAPSFAILGHALRQVFTLMENSGVFGVLEDSLEKLAPLVAQLVNALMRGLAPALPVIFQALSQLSKGAVIVLVTVVSDLLRALLPIAPLLGRIAPWVLAAVAGVKAWAIAQGLLNIALDANPIGLVVIAIAGLVIAVAEVVKHWKAVTAATRAAWHAIEAAVRAGARAVTAVIRDAWRLAGDVTRAAWHAIEALVRREVTGVRAVLSWFGRLGGLFRGWWDGAARAAASGVSAVVSWARGLPRRVLAAVGNLGRLLWHAGQDVLSGLLGGIESMVGAVVRAAESAGSDILGAVKSALGIGSPSRYTYLHGRMLAQGLIDGMDSMAGPLGAAAGRMSGAALPGGGPPARGVPRAAGGGGRVVLEIAPAGHSGLDAMFWEWLRRGIRVRGGNVQLVLGSRS